MANNSDEDWLRDRIALVSAVSSLAACLALVLVWPVEQALFDPLLGWVNPFTILKP